MGFLIAFVLLQAAGTQSAAPPAPVALDTEVRVPLTLNGARLLPRGGVFTYDMAGKSSGRGTLFDLKLAFDDLEDFPQGLYNDKLTFSIASR